MRTRNHVWVLSHPSIVLPRGMWRDHAIDGAMIRHGCDADISHGSILVDGRPGGICMIAAGADGTKTVLARFARSMV